MVSNHHVIATDPGHHLVRPIAYQDDVPPRYLYAIEVVDVYALLNAHVSEVSHHDIHGVRVFAISLILDSRMTICLPFLSAFLPHLSLKSTKSFGDL